MLNRNLIRAYAFGVLVIASGAMAGFALYSLLLTQAKSIHLRNIDETMELLQQNLKSFDIVSIENISRVLIGADYVTGLKVVTGNGFVVFDATKPGGGAVRQFEYSEPRETGERRQIGTVTLQVNHDTNAARNIALSCLTGGLLSFLLVRLLLSARSLRRELMVRAASENALREQEANLRTLLNSLTEAVIATDSNGRITQMNPVAERLTGWLYGEAQGVGINEVFRVIDSKARMQLKATIAPGVAPRHSVEHSEDVTLVSRHGAEYPISQSIAPMIAGDQSISGVVVIFRDVTAELLAQQRIREMEKMQAIGVLTGGLAHDYNNLLGIISAAAEIISLREGKRLAANSARLLETIVRTTRRGAELTSRLLAMGQTHTVEQTLFSLHASVENVVNLLKRTIDKRFDIDVALEAKNDKVMGSLSLIENALLNIGLNASQAMKADRGTFQIRTQNIVLAPEDDAVRTHHAPVGPCIRITLRDTGVGIPPENLHRIFEPFFTNRRGGGGFGLGLWAVYNTVRDHGGTIHVESQLGVETSFFIYLPVSFEKMLPPQRGKDVARPGDKTILIVDDEDDMRETLTAMLGALGCQARVAAGGEEAIRIFRQEHASIDAVMMDLNMPEMSGEDTIAALLNIAPETRIIISSGYSATLKIETQHTQKFLFLKKPYLLSDLAATLAEVFRDKALAGPPRGGSE